MVSLTIKGVKNSEIVKKHQLLMYLAFCSLVLHWLQYFWFWRWPSTINKKKWLGKECDTFKSDISFFSKSVVCRLLYAVTIFAGRHGTSLEHKVGLGIVRKCSILTLIQYMSLGTDTKQFPTYLTLGDVSKHFFYTFTFLPFNKRSHSSRMLNVVSTNPVS